MERAVGSVRRRAQGALVCAIVCVLAAPALSADAPEGGARKVVTEALAKVMEVLKDPSATDASRRDRIAEIAYAHFDFDTMSKLVVGRPWRKFTESERTEFIAAFKTHLAASYGRRLGRYNDTDVQVVGEVQEQRGDMTIQSKVVGGQFDGATMNYRMRGTSGRWEVIDVVIEGVSLVSNFRSQFKPILAQGGAQELLGRLSDKNDTLQEEIAAEEAGGAG